MANNNIVIENAHIIFRNFSGKEGKFNPAGRRNFCVILEDELAKRMIRDGWNVRYLNPREEEDQPIPYLQVAVSFNSIPPKVVMISSRGKTMMDEEDVGILDWVEIENVDLIINPYNWSVSGRIGVKAYLKSIYVTIVEDEFEMKYADVPDSAKSAMLKED